MPHPAALSESKSPVTFNESQGSVYIKGNTVVIEVDHLPCYFNRRFADARVCAVALYEVGQKEISVEFVGHTDGPLSLVNVSLPVPLPDMMDDTQLILHDTKNNYQYLALNGAKIKRPTFNLRNRAKLLN